MTNIWGSVFFRTIAFVVVMAAMFAYSQTEAAVTSVQGALIAGIFVLILATYWMPRRTASTIGNLAVFASILAYVVFQLHLKQQNGLFGAPLVLWFWQKIVFETRFPTLPHRNQPSDAQS